MINDEYEAEQAKGLARNSFISVLVTALLFAGLGYWAATTEISGAVIAQGTVIVDGKSKKVQHRDGGIVSEIFVGDQDFVKNQQLLAKLDTTELAATQSVLENELRLLLVQRARLEAEAEGLSELSSGGIDQVHGLHFDENEIKLAVQSFDASRRARLNRISQLNKQIQQVEQQIAGLQQERVSLEQQIKILEAELGVARELYDDNLVVFARVTTLEKELYNLQGQLGSIVAKIAQARAMISERQIQVDQLTEDFRAEALEKLTENRRLVFDVNQRFIAATNQLKRAEIRAPHEGVVHESILNTVGGVISASETVMLIVPQDKGLIVEAKVLPADIENIYVGQEVTLRMSAFDLKTTPELIGKVNQVAPDKSTDSATGFEFYRVRVTISQSELNRMPEENKLIAGMPVETLIKTEDRTVLTYLLKPMFDQFRLALRES